LWAQKDRNTGMLLEWGLIVRIQQDGEKGKHERTGVEEFKTGYLEKIEEQSQQSELTPKCESSRILSQKEKGRGE